MNDASDDEPEDNEDDAMFLDAPKKEDAEQKESRKERQERLMKMMNDDGLPTSHLYHRPQN